MARNAYKARKKKSGLFTYLERSLPFERLFMDGLPSRYIPVIAYSFLLGLIYVGNTHYYERTARKVDKLEQDIGALRMEFTSLKSSYMLDSKQSVVAQRVAPLGIHESNQPPFKIKLNQ
ncbi:MAG: FtsL-like putative cell division protein [Candidatus Amoebophilus sp.]